MKPNFNLEMVDVATKLALAEGMRVLQTHRYAQDDSEHVSILSKVFALPAGVVVDAGCGLGEVARLMCGMRDDLSFILLNLSELQLSHCPTGEQFTHLIGDIHAMPIADGTTDAVMFNSALCQCDTPVALAESYRVLRPGGILAINDLIKVGEHADQLEALACRALPLETLLGFITEAGFNLDIVTVLPFSDSHLRPHFADGRILDGVLPIVIRAIKVTV